MILYSVRDRGASMPRGTQTKQQQFVQIANVNLIKIISWFLQEYDDVFGIMLYLSCELYDTLIFFHCWRRCLDSLTMRVDKLQEVPLLELYTLVLYKI